MSEWIRVKDKLPETAGRYLVFELKPEHSHNCLAFNYPFPCCEPNIAYFRMYQMNDWEWHGRTQDNCSPTHWRELPSPPLY